MGTDYFGKKKHVGQLVSSSRCYLMSTLLICGQMRDHGNSDTLNCDHVLASGGDRVDYSTWHSHKSVSTFPSKPRLPWSVSEETI